MDTEEEIERAVKEIMKDTGISWLDALCSLADTRVKDV
jgi:hypothetical protein